MKNAMILAAVVGALALSACAPPLASVPRRQVDQPSPVIQNTNQSEQAPDKDQGEAEAGFLQALGSYDSERSDLGLTRLEVLDRAYKLCTETNESITEILTEAVEDEIRSTRDPAQQLLKRMEAEIVIKSNSQFWKNMRSEAIIAGLCDI